MKILSPSRSVAVLNLGRPAVRAIEDIVSVLGETDAGVSEAESIANASICASDLPDEVLSGMRRLGSGAHEPTLLIKGFEVDDHRIGPTPRHWKMCSPFSTNSATRREEFLLAVLAETVGDAFGYASLQDGRVIHNLLPIAGAELDQSGHGSKAALEWHTEDAFTPFRANFLGLLGLRNRDAIATTIGDITALLDLDDRDCQILSEPRFAVVPDEEHLRSNAIRSETSLLGGGQPSLIPILSDGPHGFELVVDRVYMTAGDSGAAGPFRRATRALDRALHRIAIAPGEILLLDNHRVVHGRDPFPARFDGTDRWLLKTSVTRDLASSAAYRDGPSGRILG